MVILVSDRVPIQLTLLKFFFSVLGLNGLASDIFERIYHYMDYTSLIDPRKHNKNVRYGRRNASLVKVIHLLQGVPNETIR